MNGPHRTTCNQITEQKSTRIEALSNGVFPIAMTLLVQLNYGTNE